jgi:hypothetical protein
LNARKLFVDKTVDRDPVEGLVQVAIGKRAAQSRHPGAQAAIDFPARQ